MLATPAIRPRHFGAAACCPSAGLQTGLVAIGGQAAPASAACPGMPDGAMAGAAEAKNPSFAPLAGSGAAVAARDVDADPSASAAIEDQNSS